MTCEHYARNPEGIEWSIEDSLDHFINCLDRDTQLKCWQWYRDDWDLASKCRMHDHDYQIREMQQYIIKLRKQLADYKD